MITEQNSSTEMKSVALSRGRVEEFALLGGSSLVLAAIVLWGFIASPNFLRHCGTTLQITISVIWLFAAHWRFRRGNFELRWDDQHAQILNHGAIVFDGKFAEMALIDQDLRGYYLYPLNHNDVYRLKRSFVDAELQQALDAR